MGVLPGIQGLPARCCPLGGVRCRYGFHDPVDVVCGLRRGWISLSRNYLLAPALPRASGSKGSHLAPAHVPSPNHLLARDTMKFRLLRSPLAVADGTRGAVDPTRHPPRASSCAPNASLEASPEGNSRPILELDGVHKEYNSGTAALRDVSFAVGAGEFLTILGESGSGKTTLLRTIAGLEEPSRVRRFSLDGQPLLGVPANKRNCATVFQHYALFPHMNVLENVRYGLKLRGYDRTVADDRANDALRMVRLGHKANASISQLSGGEKQRVALARALVIEPQLLLLDEPLGALDEKLRHDMQEELVELHRRLGITFIYVTHSQEEALAMSDRIILMQKGMIRQIGSPHDLFDAPNSRFSAEFMGYENIIPVAIVASGPTSATAQYGKHSFVGRPLTATTGPAAMAIRAERVRVVHGTDDIAADANSLSCTIRSQEYRGRYTDIVADTPCGPMKARLFGTPPGPLVEGTLVWQSHDAVLIPSDC